VDWSQGYEFLDTELQQVARDAEFGRRYADKLVKVWRKAGDEQWVLVHIEIQSQPDIDFSQRMYVYSYRLFDRFNRLVASLAILGDTRLGWRPSEFGYTLWGCEVHFRFPVLKLAEYVARWSELEASRNPFAIVVMAHLKAQETQRDPIQRQVWKLSIMRRMYEQGYSRQEIIDLFHFVDWVMWLPPELESTFRQEIQQLEEERRMPYVSSWERDAKAQGFQQGMQEGVQQGIQEGRQQGLQQGIQRQLLRVLEHRFGELPAILAQRLAPLAAETLETLMDVALTADSLALFVEKLPTLPEDQAEP
jgi:hypothetical protein